MAFVCNYNVNRCLPFSLQYDWNGANLNGSLARGLSVPIGTSAWYNSIDMEKYNYHLVLRSAFAHDAIDNELETEIKGKNIGFTSPNFPQYQSFNDVDAPKLRSTNTILYMSNTEAEFDDGTTAPLNQLHMAKHNYAFFTPILLNDSVGMAFFNNGYRLQIDVYDFSRGEFVNLSPAGTDRTLPMILNFTILECKKD